MKKETKSEYPKVTITHYVNTEDGIETENYYRIDYDKDDNYFPSYGRYITSVNRQGLLKLRDEISKVLVKE